MFHGYTRFYPLRTRAAHEIAVVLMNNLFYHVDVPRTIFSDRAKEFVSELLKELCDMAKVEWIYSARRTPSQNGRVERRHNLLNVAMKGLTNKKRWDEVLPGLWRTPGTH